MRAVTDIYGAVAARYAYEPFGSLTTASGLVDSELHRFMGKHSDLETSLSYFNARYYDPTLGRFTSSDPAKDGLNWFEYCNGNPITHIDQNGEYYMEYADGGAFGTSCFSAGSGELAAAAGAAALGVITSDYLEMAKKNSKVIKGNINDKIVEHLGKVSGYKDPLDPKNLKEGWKKELAKFYNNIKKAMGTPGPKTAVASIMINAFLQAENGVGKAYLTLEQMKDFFDGLKTMGLPSIDITDPIWGIKIFDTWFRSRH